jgi:putative aminopeptidase FrvX
MAVSELRDKIDEAEALVTSSHLDQREGIFVLISVLREIVKAIEELEMSSPKK